MGGAGSGRTPVWESMTNVMWVKTRHVDGVGNIPNWDHVPEGWTPIDAQRGFIRVNDFNLKLLRRVMVDEYANPTASMYGSGARGMQAERAMSFLFPRYRKWVQKFGVGDRYHDSYAVQPGQGRVFDRRAKNWVLDDWRNGFAKWLDEQMSICATAIAVYKHQCTPSAMGRRAVKGTYIEAWHNSNINPLFYVMKALHRDLPKIQR